MIFAYRNVDSPNGDFGLVKQEGDERFVVLTVEEYAALREAEARAEKAEAERDEAIGRTSMERYSDGRVGEARMESVVYELGVCTDWYFDDYDCSVEMLGVRNGWLPTKEERDLLAATGISIAWLSYLDGTGTLVHLTTGQHEACSPRGPRPDKSALVTNVERERNKAKALLKDCREHIPLVDPCPDHDVDDKECQPGIERADLLARLDAALGEG